ncbi:MAG: PGF-CTERM sorting domain-containing protein [Euryarchaeota archaeon]|nr:PGF-CTERM sorting domain-containing protein [Euryarchaeota archaeon]
MKWKTGFVFVLVMLAVASIGVTNVFGQNITADELWKTADELWNNLTIAVDNVTSVTYDMHSTQIWGEGTFFDDTQGASKMQFERYHHVTVDYIAEKSYIVLSRSDTENPYRKEYVDGKTKYYRYRPEGGEWENWKIADTNYQWSKWEKREELRNIKPPVYIKILGSEELNGEDCWIVKMRMSDLPEPKEVEVTTWIAKKDYLPRLSVKKAIRDIRVDTTKQFYDYNKPINIIEPPDLPTPTPTPTPASPGFGIVFAITGLLTVVSLIRRRRKN